MPHTKLLEFVPLIVLCCRCPPGANTTRKASISFLNYASGFLNVLRDDMLSNSRVIFMSCSTNLYSRTHSLRLRIKNINVLFKDFVMVKYRKVSD